MNMVAAAIRNLYGEGNIIHGLY